MKIKGELEIDEERGVIYFHQNDTKFIKYLQDSGFYPVVTVLRICRLPKLCIQRSKGSIDITHMHGVNYAKTNTR